MLITNAFSINMLPAQAADVRFTPVDRRAAAMVARNAVSAIGHAETAAVVSADLGVDVPAQRATVGLSSDRHERILVAQYRGPRLPEGATELPSDATIQYWMVTLLTFNGEENIWHSRQYAGVVDPDDPLGAIQHGLGEPADSVAVHEDGMVDSYRKVGGGFAPSAYDDGTLAEQPGVRYEFFRRYSAEEVANAFANWALAVAQSGE